MQEGNDETQTGADGGGFAQGEGSHPSSPHVNNPEPPSDGLMNKVRSIFGKSQGREEPSPPAADAMENPQPDKAPAFGSPGVNLGAVPTQLDPNFDPFAEPEPVENAVEKALKAHPSSSIIASTSSNPGTLPPATTFVTPKPAAPQKTQSQNPFGAGASAQANSEAASRLPKKRKPVQSPPPSAAPPPPQGASPQPSEAARLGHLLNELGDTLPETALVALRMQMQKQTAAPASPAPSPTTQETSTTGDKAADLVARIEKLETQKAELHAEHQATLSKQSQELSSEKARSAELRKKVDGFVRRQNQIRTESASLLKDREAQLVAEKAGNQKLQGQIQNLETDQLALQHRYEAIVQQHSELTESEKARKEKVPAQIKKLKDQQSKLREQHQALVKQHESEIASANARTALLIEEIEKLVTRQTHIRNQREELLATRKEEIATEKARNEELLSRIRDHERHQEQIRGEHDSLLKEREAAIATAKENAVELQRRLEELEDQRADLQNRHDELVRIRDEESGSESERNQQSREEIRTLEEQLSQLQQAHDALLIDRDGKVASTNARSEELSQRIAKLDSQHAELQARNESLQKAHGEELASEQARNQEILSQIKDLENEHAKLQSEHMALRKQRDEEITAGKARQEELLGEINQLERQHSELLTQHKEFRDQHEEKVAAARTRDEELLGQIKQLEEMRAELERQKQEQEKKYLQEISLREDKSNELRERLEKAREREKEIESQAHERAREHESRIAAMGEEIARLDAAHKETETAAAAAAREHGAEENAAQKKQFEEELFKQQTQLEELIQARDRTQDALAFTRGQLEHAQSEHQAALDEAHQRIQRLEEQLQHEPDSATPTKSEHTAGHYNPNSTCAAAPRSMPKGWQEKQANKKTEEAPRETAAPPAAEPKLPASSTVPVVPRFQKSGGAEKTNSPPNDENLPVTSSNVEKPRVIPSSGEGNERFAPLFIPGVTTPDAEKPEDKLPENKPEEEKKEPDLENTLEKIEDADSIQQEKGEDPAVAAAAPRETAPPVAAEAASSYLAQPKSLEESDEETSSIAQQEASRRSRARAKINPYEEGARDTSGNHDAISTRNVRTPLHPFVGWGVLALAISTSLYVVANRAAEVSLSSSSQPVVLYPDSDDSLPTRRDEKIAALHLQLDHQIIELKSTLTEVEAREIAQRFVNVAAAGRGAGIDFVKDAEGDLVSTVDAIAKGGNIIDPSSPLRGALIAYEGLDEKSKQKALPYLQIEDGLLTFTAVDRNAPEPARGHMPSAFLEDLLDDLEQILLAQGVSLPRKHARQLAAVSASARAVNIDFVTRAQGNLAAAVSAIVKGDVAENILGTYEDVFFGLPELSADEQRAAAPFLEIQDGELKFVPDSPLNPEPTWALRRGDKLDILGRAVGLSSYGLDQARGRLQDLHYTATEMRNQEKTEPQFDLAAILHVIALNQAEATSDAQRLFNVQFAGGSLGLQLPGDFHYYQESENDLFIMPKNPGPHGAAWLRVHLQKKISGEDGDEAADGTEAVKDMALAKGRPLKKTEDDKVYYWTSEDYHDGARLCRVKNHLFGFGNSVVMISSGTAKGREDAPESQRVAEVLPDIISSLQEL